MTFAEAANSRVVWVLVVAMMAFVMTVAVIFFRRAWIRAQELGFTKAELGAVVKATVSYSLVPSVAILIGLFGIAALVGLPWGWYRLSVLGSVSYEIMAADTALKAMGTSIDQASAGDFVLVASVMSLCITGGLVTSALFARKLQSGAMKLKEGDRRWGALGNSTFMLTIMVVLLVPMLLAGGVGLLTWATSVVITVILALVMKATGARWLNEFILAIALVGAMAASVMWTTVIG